MIPILCDSTKTLAELVSDSTNGIGRLTEATSATVTEERNGSYYLEITYPATGRLFSQLSSGGIIKAKPNDSDSAQLFRIAQITTPLSGQVEILAYHIGYDLARAVVLPFSATGAAAALTAMRSAMIGGSAFSFTTDISDTTTAFSVSDVSGVRTVIGGSGGLAETFDGELRWDGLSVELLASRGSDRGVSITYGKNLTDVKQEAILDKMYTMIVPYYKSGDTLTRGTNFILREVSDDDMRVLALDVSQLLDTSSSSTPTVTEIDTACAYYVKNHPELTTPQVSIDVAFQPLWKAKNFRSVLPVEHVSLCDTVTVRYARLGISTTAKVTKCVYNVLTESYDSITLGQPKREITDTIVSVSALADIAKTTADKAQETAENAGSSGGGGSSSATEMTDGSLTWGTKNKVVLKTNSDSTGAQFTGDGAVELNLASSSGISTVTASASPTTVPSIIAKNGYSELGIKGTLPTTTTGYGGVSIYANSAANRRKWDKSATLTVGHSGTTGTITARARTVALGPGTAEASVDLDADNGTVDVTGAKGVALSSVKKITLNDKTSDAYIIVDPSYGTVRIYGKNGVYINDVKQ